MKLRSLASLLACLLLLPASSVGADPGDLDTSFGSGGVRLVDFGGYEESTDVARVGNKIVQVGRTRPGAPGTPYDMAVARYTRKGRLDRTFSGDGRKRIRFLGDDAASSVAAAAGGRIWVAGVTETPSGDSHMALARLRPNGALDNSFSKDGKRVIRFPGEASAEDLVPMPDGSVVLVGWVSSVASSGDFALARVGPDGRLDKRFGKNGRVITDVASEEEGALAGARVGKGIVVTGWTAPTHVSDTALVRYRAGGRLDKKFGGGDGKRTIDMGGGLYDEGRGVVSVGGGKVVVASLVVGATDNVGMARFRKRGGLDPTFRGGGLFVEDFGANDRPGDLALQGKKLVVGGDSDGTAAFRFKANGNRDDSFGETGQARLPLGPIGVALVILKGRIVVAGHGTGSGVPLDFGLVAFRP